jgi:hypothetical protein
MLNREALDRFVKTLKSNPSSMTSVEEALHLVTNTGVSARIACSVKLHQRCLHLLAGPNSEPMLKAVFPSREVEIQLNRSGQKEWEGVLEYPWDEFSLLLSSGLNVARVPIYGSCAATAAQHYLDDETTPVIGLCELGAAIAEVLTGQIIPAGLDLSTHRNVLHTAEHVAELLSAIAMES